MLLTSDVYQFHRLLGVGPWGGNVFLLAGESLTLVDTGFKGRADHIFKETMRLGFSMSDISSIIITHHHPDHTGSLATIKEVTGARVLAHPADAPYIEGHLLQPGPARHDWFNSTLAPYRGLWSTTPVTVDEFLNDGDTLPILGGVKVLHTPGHTEGSISLFIPDKRLVIIGDLLSNSLGLRFPSRTFTVDMSKEISSIKRIAELDFDTVCFGHGLAMTKRARQRISAFAERVSVSSRYS